MIMKENNTRTSTESIKEHIPRPRTKGASIRRHAERDLQKQDQRKTAQSGNNNTLIWQC